MGNSQPSFSRPRDERFVYIDEAKSRIRASECEIVANEALFVYRAQAAPDGRHVICRLACAMDPHPDGLTRYMVSKNDVRAQIARQKFGSDFES